MSKKTIGIIGGAGPMAGIVLCRQIIRECQTKYRCEKDADFPKLILLSYPFSEMLSNEVNVEQIKNELKACIHNLRKFGADLIGIACITLYAFLDEVGDDLVNLPKVLQAAKLEDPLVLSTSTTRSFSLFKQFSYPNERDQKEVDLIIDSIMRGNDMSKRIVQLIKSQDAKTIVLGCTELSLCKDQLGQMHKTIVDPIELLARKMVERAFAGYSPGIN